MDLLCAIKPGDPRARQAAEQFAQRYHRPLSAYLRAIVANSEEAQEMAQGFFAEVFKQFDRSKGNFRAYLKQSIRNYLVSGSRRRFRRKRHASGEEMRPVEWTRGSN